MRQTKIAVPVQERQARGRRHGRHDGGLSLALARVEDGGAAGARGEIDEERVARDFVGVDDLIVIGCSPLKS